MLGILGIAEVAVGQAPAGADANAKKQTFLIQGLHCPPCTRTVESSLRHTPGVQSARVDWNSKNAWVTFDDRQISAQRVAQAIDATPHMMGGGMHYHASLALKVAGVKDAAAGQPAKDALGKVPGVANVFVYPQQEAVAIDFAKDGNLTSQQLIDVLAKAGMKASVYE
jgi:copper chaperone CopZ